MFMERSKLLKAMLVAIVASGCYPAGVTAKYSVPLIPVNGKSVTVLSNGKEKKYFLLRKSLPLEIQVDGPTDVKVLTRIAMPASASGAQHYTITVSEQSNVVKKYSTASDKSGASYAGSEDILGKVRKFTLNVPEGSHSYEVSLEDTPFGSAALRFEASTKKLKASNQATVRLEPLVYDRVATAVVMEKMITYYVCTKENPISVRIVGPTTLEFDTRLNFDSKLQGEQNYAISIWDETKKLASKSFTTTKALEAAYSDWREVVPGKINTYSVKVPDGVHVYKFKLEESLALSASFKFSIPEKDTRKSH